MSVTFYAGKWQGEEENKRLSWVEEIEDHFLNVSNTSAIILLSLVITLEEDQELCGQMSISNFRKIADLVDNPDLQTPTLDIKEKGKPRVISFGYNIDRLRGYAERIEKLADLAEQYEADLIYWG